jgi:hypothetical protein
MADIIVTGLPRSGSAVVSALLDYLPDTVCLNMPPWQNAYARQPLDILPFCKWLVGDFAWARRRLLDGEAVSDLRAADGAPLLDGMHDPRQPRNEAGAPREVLFLRPGLSDQFHLGMRQTIIFTSVLPRLVKFRHFNIVAVIRHPIDVLSAWQRLPQPLLAPGNPPGIARYWPEALAIVNADAPEADRFAQLYELFIRRYHELGDQIHILKYEDVIDNPMVVSELVGAGTLSAAASMIENRPRIRDARTAEAFRDSLRKFGVFTKLYYPDL